MDGITSVLQCQAACFSDSSCVAIDYNHNNARGQYCWLTRERGYASAPHSGITHFILDRDCAGTLNNIAVNHVTAFVLLVLLSLARFQYIHLDDWPNVSPG